MLLDNKDRHRDYLVKNSVKDMNTNHILEMS